MSTSPQSDDLDTDLLETRFESSRSPHGQRRASPASDEVSEPEADTLPHQAGDADTAAPAESPNDGDEEPRSGTADALPEAPPGRANHHAGGRRPHQRRRRQARCRSGGPSHREPVRFGSGTACGANGRESGRVDVRARYD